MENLLKVYLDKKEISETEMKTGVTQWPTLYSYMDIDI